jgi:hypothetical protein
MNPVIKFEQMGFMGAWRNEFICIAMDVSAQFNICIQPQGRVGKAIVGWQSQA